MFVILFFVLVYRSVEHAVLEVSVRFFKVADNIYLDLSKNIYIFRRLFL